MKQQFERNTLIGTMLVLATVPLWAHDPYWLHIAIMVLFYSMLAISLNLIVGYVGEFSLGHTVFLGTGAYVAALLAKQWNFPIWATLLSAAVLCALVGLFIGWVTLRLKGPFFVIVTLACAEVMRLVASNWVALTNGPMGLAGIPQPSFVTDNALAGKRLYFVIAWVLVAIALYLSYRFVYSATGRAAVAIRENRYVAQSVGIRPFHYAMVALVLGAVLTGMAGGFYAHYISFVGPEVFGFSFTISMIIMVLVGGKGTLVGPLLGALLITIVEELLRDFQELRLSIFGLLVMVVVLFMPKGLMGFLTQRRTHHE